MRVRFTTMLPSAVAVGAVIVGLTGPIANAAPPDATGSCANREAQVEKAQEKRLEKAQQGLADCQPEPESNSRRIIG